jgi:DNA primase small subunit
MDNDASRWQSLEFLKNRFREYYENVHLELPDRFGKREFAFVFFGGKGMLRHLSFEKKHHFIRFLQEKHPAHAYYSTAYYQQPNASTMQEKQWMGAELIFDLDSDHLPGSESMSYAESLDKVKHEFSKLVQDFLMNDFGFKEKYLELYFSGGRGYHCHVKDPKILRLDSNERREIVDYITGRDLQDSLVFHETVTNKKDIGGRQVAQGKSLTMPAPSEPGWKGRISRGIIDIVDDILTSDAPVEKLREYGVKEKDAERLMQDLSGERVQRIREGKLDQSKTIRRFFLNSILRKTAVAMSAGETDEPVTCDVKRLIRLPFSLHGKTGLKVTEVTLDTLQDFDPLRDAVVFNDDSVNVDVKEPVHLKMNDEEFRLSSGIQQIPQYLAVFLIGRNMATIAL